MKRHIYYIFAVVLALVMVAPQTQAQYRSTSSHSSSTAKKSSSHSSSASKSSSSSKKKQHHGPERLDDLHHIAFWGGVGYSGLLNSYDMGEFGKHSFVGGGGGLIGLGYEYHYKKFQMYFGPEFRIFSSQDNLLYNQAAAQLRLPEYGQTYNYYFANTGGKYEKLSQTEIVGQVMLPIMFGAAFPIENFGKLFFMAGGKIGYTLLSSYSQKGTLTTAISDNWAFDENWYNIGHNTESKSGKLYSGSDKFGLDATVSAEFGIVLDDFLPADFQDANEDSKHPWHMRVSLFVDYGLPNLNIATDKPFAAANEAEIAQPGTHGLETQSLHGSSWAQGSRVNSLLVGAKFTALLQLNKPKRPKPQNPYLVLRLMNARTKEPIGASEPRANVEITALANGRVTKRNPNSRAMVLHRGAPGDYRVAISQPGYLPYEPFEASLFEDVNTNLKEKMDTTYIYLYPQPSITLHVTDIKTGKPVSASIAVIDTASNKTQVSLTHDAAQAKATTKLPIERFYAAVVKAENYHQQIFNIGVQGKDDIELSFALTPIEKRTYILENMFFASNETTILPQSEPSLKELYEMLRDNPEVRILITGHTDWVGSDEDNQILSEGRAASVKQSMVDRGIDASRIETTGKGESMPIATNETEKGRQRNRRVEITILESGSSDPNVEQRKDTDEE